MNICLQQKTGSVARSASLHGRIFSAEQALTNIKYLIFSAEQALTNIKY